MQILYLVPPALLLWRNFGDDLSGLLILVPVVVMASGQLAGGLAWLAVSGEDAPDLVASAPVPERAVIAAKIEAVIGAVVVVVGPLVLALALAAPRIAAVAALGVAVSAVSGTAIQIWFRAQAKRSPSTAARPPRASPPWPRPCPRSSGPAPPRCSPPAPGSPRPWRYSSC
jgi:ABC-2 type transport system permease protein